MSEKWKDTTIEILKNLDLIAVYSELGVEIVGEPSNESGWAPAKAYGRPDNNPSAGVNFETGRYHDFGNGLNLSLWEFAVHVGRFSDWKEARKEYAQRAGVKLPKGREKEHPRDKLKFKPWNDLLVYSWCDKKPGITPEAVRLAGGRLASWPSTNRYTVLAFPIYGIGGLNEDPIGYTLYNITGDTLPDGGGNPRKMILAGGSRKGWIGQMGLSQLSDPDVRAVLKVEGTTDLLAVQAMLTSEGVDDWAVISNSHGSTERPQDEMCAMLTGKVVYVLHDADQAGETGGKRWAERIANFAESVKQARLLYEIKDSGGEDVRDWINAGGSWDGLQHLCFGGEEISPPEAEVLPEERGDDLSMEEGLLKDIGIQVLGEMDHGAVKVWSEYHRKRDVIKEVAKLTHQRLLQIGGPKIREKVLAGTQDDIPGFYKLSEVKDAISIVAGFIRISDEQELGRGIWRGKDERGEETNNLILVGAGEAVVRNGKPDLQRVTVPRYAGRLLDMDSSETWFSFEHLEHMYQQSEDAHWVQKSVAELEETVSRWKWANQDQCPKVATGLILATWIQSIWNWRPQVVIVGKSGAGKSTFFRTLKSLFGSLAIDFVGATTAAGLQQAIQKTAEIGILDEFDSNKERSKILEMLRSAGGGGRVGKGTPGQRGMQLTLRHIVWLAGIEDGLTREPDMNRFINLALVKPRAEDMGQLNLPSRSHLAHLGQRLLVAAMRIAFDAKQLAMDLTGERFPDFDFRVAESFAVPAACYASVFDGLQPRDVLHDMLAIVDREIEDDEQQLIDAILESSVFYGSKRVSVSAAIADTGSPLCLETIESAGVGVIDNYAHAERHLFINETSVKRHLLKGTEWERRSINQVLLRIDGAERCRHRIAGKQCRGIKIPFSATEALRDLPIPERDEDDHDKDELF